MKNEKIKASSVYGEMRTTLPEIVDTFLKFNEENNIEYGRHKDTDPEISAVIVYAQSNFTNPYSEASRSYRVTNQSGERFFYGMLGSSIYGDSLDGTDLRARLDAYNWTIERCYFEKL